MAFEIIRKNRKRFSGFCKVCAGSREEVYLSSGLKCDFIRLLQKELGRTVQILNIKNATYPPKRARHATTSTRGYNDASQIWQRLKKVIEKERLCKKGCDRKIVKERLLSKTVKEMLWKKDCKRKIVKERL